MRVPEPIEIIAFVAVLAALFFIVEPISDGDRDRLRAFIDAGKAHGLADDFILALLKAKGWSKRHVYGALASYYERTLNVSLPERGPRGENASDAFLYLLTFISLGAWVFAAGYVFDALIDAWFPSELAGAYGASSFRAQVAVALVTILVALPIFAWVSRTISARISRRPELAGSRVRKWLTYGVLVIAALCLLGGVILFCLLLLTGNLTLPFLLKTLVLAVAAGSTFTYYLATVRGEAVAPRRDRAYGAFGLALAALALTVGFLDVRTPARAAAVALDDRRSASLAAIAGRLHARWSENRRLPANLSGLNLAPRDLVDPQTRKPYDYTPMFGSKYMLCAEFVLSEPWSDCSEKDAADSQF